MGICDVVADVTSYEELKRAALSCDALVHLAAHRSPFRRPPQEVHNTNVVASYNALCAAVDLGIERIRLASSVNAIGGAFSRRPRYDYLPLDEAHPTYNEDPYSLSKWVCEAQASSVCRLHGQLSVASLRLHQLVADRATVATRTSRERASGSRNLWGYTTLHAAAQACLSALEVTWKGHEVIYVVVSRTAVDWPTAELCQEFYPDVPLRKELSGNEGLFCCAKAVELLGLAREVAD